MNGTWDEFLSVNVQRTKTSLRLPAMRAWDGSSTSPLPRWHTSERRWLPPMLSQPIQIER